MWEPSPYRNLGAGGQSAGTLIELGGDLHPSPRLWMWLLDTRSRVGAGRRRGRGLSGGIGWLKGDISSILGRSPVIPVQDRPAGAHALLQVSVCRVPMTCFHVISGDPAPSRATKLPVHEGTEGAQLGSSPWVTRRRKMLVCVPPREPWCSPGRCSS